MFEPGDVLFTHGRSPISWAIRFLDRSEVNHVAIALDASTLAEARADGLRTGPIEHSVSANKFVWQHRARVPDAAPAVATAREYVDQAVPYAYQQIALLAILCATRSLPMPRLAKRFVRAALDGAADALNQKLDDEGKRLMICSEFVYRCYAEGQPPHFLASAGAVAAGVGEFTLVDSWAPQHRELLAAHAASGSAAPAAAPAGAELDQAIAEYAAAFSAEDDEAAAIAAEYAPDVAIASAAGEPSDEELAGSLVRASAALERAMPYEGAVPAGLVTDLGLGALKGLLDTRMNPNFVTPGDLLRAGTLDHMQTHSR